ncbi:hypothetical protein, partial [Bacillus cereus]
GDTGPTVLISSYFATQTNSNIIAPGAILPLSNQIAPTVPGAFTLAGDIITINQSGVYKLNYEVGTSTTAIIAVRKNGTPNTSNFTQYGETRSTTDVAYIVGQTQIVLNAMDTIALMNVGSNAITLAPKFINGQGIVGVGLQITKVG